MSNKENIIEKTKSFLETAQKEVLKELCSERNLFERLFRNKKPETLKQIQSNVSKALDQIKAFYDNETNTTSKLQTHLNEKNQIIKSLESTVGSISRENTLLKEQLETQQKRSEQKATITTEQEVIKLNGNQHKEFENAIERLEKENKILSEKFDSSEKELNSAQEMTDELSKRLRRLKSEIIVP